MTARDGDREREAPCDHAKGDLSPQTRCPVRTPLFCPRRWSHRGRGGLSQCNARDGSRARDETDKRLVSERRGEPPRKKWPLRPFGTTRPEKGDRREREDDTEQAGPRGRRLQEPGSAEART